MQERKRQVIVDRGWSRGCDSQMRTEQQRTGTVPVYSGRKACSWNVYQPGINVNRVGTSDKRASLVVDSDFHSAADYVVTNAIDIDKKDPDPDHTIPERTTREWYVGKKQPAKKLSYKDEFTFGNIKSSQGFDKNLNARGGDKGASALKGIKTAYRLGYRRRVFDSRNMKQCCLGAGTFGQGSVKASEPGFRPTLASCTKDADCLQTTWDGKDRKQVCNKGICQQRDADRNSWALPDVLHTSPDPANLTYKDGDRAPAPLVCDTIWTPGKPYVETRTGQLIDGNPDKKGKSADALWAQSCGKMFVSDECEGKWKGNTTHDSRFCKNMILGKYANGDRPEDDEGAIDAVVCSDGKGIRDEVLSHCAQRVTVGCPDGKEPGVKMMACPRYMSSTDPDGEFCRDVQTHPNFSIGADLKKHEYCKKYPFDEACDCLAGDAVNASMEKQKECTVDTSHVFNPGIRKVMCLQMKPLKDAQAETIASMMRPNRSMWAQSCSMGYTVKPENIWEAPNDGGMMHSGSLTGKCYGNNRIRQGDKRFKPEPQLPNICANIVEMDIDTCIVDATGKKKECGSIFDVHLRNKCGTKRSEKRSSSAPAEVHCNENGKRVNGECQCYPGWEGPFCDKVVVTPQHEHDETPQRERDETPASSFPWKWVLGFILSLFIGIAVFS